MINDGRIINALEEMKYDIETTMVRDDLDRWSYHISIYSKNDVGLEYCSCLMKMLGIRTNFLGLVPVMYKYCAFDCMKVCTIFQDIYTHEDINTEGITVLECSTIKDDDFYILIMKDSKINEEKNIVMAYKTLHEYYK